MTAARPTLRRLAASLAAAAAFGLLPAAAWASDADSFFRAVRQDNVSAMRSLLQRGTDPNLVDENGTSGLELALQEELWQVARVLIDDPRLQPNALNKAGESPLMLAALKGQLDLARRLLTRGAQVNKDGWTPLHYAASGGQPEIIRLLLQRQAVLDAPSPNGTTPLMMAAGYGTPEAVKLLIEAGADIDLRNQQQMTALDFARRGERPDAIQLLQQAARYKAQGRTYRPAYPAAAAPARAEQTTGRADAWPGAPSAAPAAPATPVAPATAPAPSTPAIATQTTPQPALAEQITPAEATPRTVAPLPAPTPRQHPATRGHW